MAQNYRLHVQDETGPHAPSFVTSAKPTHDVLGAEEGVSPVFIRDDQPFLACGAITTEQSWDVARKCRLGAMD